MTDLFSRMDSQQAFLIFFLKLVFELMNFLIIFKSDFSGFCEFLLRNIRIDLVVAFLDKFLDFKMLLDHLLIFVWRDTFWHKLFSHEGADLKEGGIKLNSNFNEHANGLIASELRLGFRLGEEEGA